MMRAIAYLLTWLYPAPSVEEALEGATSGNEPGGLQDYYDDQRERLPGDDSLSYDMGF
jgi:hypothetical protein